MTKSRRKRRAMIRKLVTKFRQKKISELSDSLIEKYELTEKEQNKIIARSKESLPNQEQQAQKLTKLVVRIVRKSKSKLPELLVQELKLSVLNSNMNSNDNTPFDESKVEAKKITEVKDNYFDLDLEGLSDEEFIIESSQPVQKSLTGTEITMKTDVKIESVEESLEKPLKTPLQSPKKNSPAKSGSQSDSDNLIKGMALIYLLILIGIFQ